MGAKRLDSEFVSTVEIQGPLLTGFDINKRDVKPSGDEIDMLRFLLVVVPAPEVCLARNQRKIGQVPEHQSIFNQREFTSVLYHAFLP